MNSTDWLQIKLRTTNQSADVIAELLEQLGAMAVSYTDAEDSPILEPKPGERRLWPNTEVTGLLAQGFLLLVLTVQQYRYTIQFLFGRFSFLRKALKSGLLFPRHLFHRQCEHAASNHF